MLIPGKVCLFRKSPHPWDGDLASDRQVSEPVTEGEPQSSIPSQRGDWVPAEHSQAQAKEAKLKGATWTSVPLTVGGSSRMLVLDNWSKSRPHALMPGEDAGSVSLQHLGFSLRKRKHDHRH